jgi:alkylation response protein AidB-like acyl-CoA dehydrogenase
LRIVFHGRANAHAIVAGDPDDELLRAADRLWDGQRAALPDAGEVAIDFAWGERADGARRAMRAFIEKHGGHGRAQWMRDSLDGFDLELQKEVAKEGLLYPELPQELGGLGYSGREATAIREVQAEYGWNLVVPFTTDILWKIIWHFGSERLKNEVLPEIASGDAYCSMGYTEPSCGSDIFAVRTSATRQGDDWIINGQKMFTSSGHRASYSLILTRTAADKYGGITLFLLPLRQAGYQVTEIKTVGDDRTNVTFYSNMQVPDAYRIGEVNGGVKVMAQALAIEQSSGELYTASLGFMLRHGLDWAREAQRDRGGRAIDDPRVRLALAEVAARLHITDALSRRGIWAFETNNVRKHEGPMVKLFGSESWLSMSQKLLRMTGPDSLLRGYAGAGAIEWMARRCIPGTVYAGTSEVQRSILAEAGLGLPRSRAK